MSALLEMHDVSIVFRRYAAWFSRESITGLAHVSLSLGRGEVLAMIGASGAGKSLVAQAILGLLRPNATVTGRMAFDGRVLDAQALAGLRGRRISLVPQSVAALDPLARVGSQLRWCAARRDATCDVEAVLAGVGLEARVAMLFPHELSGGMARRVLIAMATLGAPDLIIADEPTNGLDPQNTQAILQLLCARAGRQAAVLLISHDLEAALGIADRVAVLRDGRIEGIEPALSFAGHGEAIVTPYALQLWRALPGRGFGAEDALAVAS